MKRFNCFILFILVANFQSYAQILGTVHDIQNVVVGEENLWNVWDGKEVYPPLIPSKQCDWIQFEGGGLTRDMCIHSEHDTISNHMRRKGFWEYCNILTRLWREGRGGVYIEVGANIGACMMQVLLTTSAKMILFEPHPDNLFCITSTLLRLDYNMRSRVVVYPIGVSNVNTIGVFYTSVVNWGNTNIGQFQQDWPDEEQLFYSFTNQVRTVDSIFEYADNYEINLMKMDVQGHECQALDGMSKVISSIKTFRLKVALFWLANQGCSVSTVIEKFEEKFTIKKRNKDLSFLMDELEDENLYFIEGSGKKNYAATVLNIPNIVVAEEVEDIEDSWNIWDGQKPYPPSVPWKECEWVIFRVDGIEKAKIHKGSIHSKKPKSSKKSSSKKYDSKSYNSNNSKKSYDPNGFSSKYDIKTHGSKTHDSKTHGSKTHDSKTHGSKTHDSKTYDSRKSGSHYIRETRSEYSRHPSYETQNPTTMLPTSTPTSQLTMTGSIPPPSEMEICVHKDSDITSKKVKKNGKDELCDNLLELWDPDGSDIYLDIGSSIGICLFQILLSTDARIFAFEPNPDNLFCLTSTLLRLDKQLRSRVVVYPIALGNVNGNEVLLAENGNYGNSCIGKFEQENPFLKKGYRTHNVQVRKLDHIFPASESLKINLMKLNVQGYECQVLDGMKKVFNNINRMRVTASKKWMGNQRCIVPGLMNRLSTKGFEMRTKKNPSDNEPGWNINVDEYGEKFCIEAEKLPLNTDYQD